MITVILAPCLEEHFNPEGQPFVWLQFTKCYPATVFESHVLSLPMTCRPYLPLFAVSLIGIKGWMLKGLIRYCLSQTSSLMCHNSLSEPCPHLVRWLMGISIIGIPIATLLTSLSCISPLLTSYPKIPPGPNRSVWHKCQTQSGSGVNTHKHGSHSARQPSFRTNTQNKMS